LLGNNRLTSEVFWVVRSVTWLQYLDLSYNWLVQLPYAMLADMRALQILSMTHAHIRNIDPNAFVGMRDLQFLYLSANQLDDINPEMFEVRLSYCPTKQLSCTAHNKRMRKHIPC